MNEEESLNRIERKVDEVIVRLERVAANQETHQGLIVDHEGRLRVIEKGRWPLPQIATLLALASVVVAVLNSWKAP